MKNLILIVVTAVFVLNCYGQNDSIYGIVDGLVVYENPEILPVFGDCSKVEKKEKENSKELIQLCSQQNFFDFLGRNQNYPEMARRKGVSGTVFIQFIIDTTGSVTNVELIRGVEGGELLNNEALRVIRLSPNWHPGEHEGEKVSTLFKIPIRFALR